ncbi:MAG: guanylate kinase [Succinatimonas hippei]|nr:guanylate kinase [Succinatimonas hippei]
MKKGQLFIVSAPSGAGKSSLINALLTRFNADDSMRLSISHTTRAPRPGEVNHVAYHFVSEDEFKTLIARGAFYEYANVFGHYYGTSREIVEQWVSEGKDVLFDIDWQGARQIRKISPDARSIFIIPPSLDELKHRLETRGQDSEDVIDGRMEKAMREISHYSEYDHVIINDDFDKALNEFRSIIIAARDETKIQSELVDAIFPDRSI